jgi:glucosyl-3-phosphoglycerate synthase
LITERAALAHSIRQIVVPESSRLGLRSLLMDQSDWRSWFERRTFGPPDPGLDELVTAKREAGVSLSVCIPALNEERTIGDIVRMVDFLAEQGFVDEIVLSDSGSTDATPELAEVAGARVITTGPLPATRGGGKGAAMWRGAGATTGDIVCFLDADVLNFGPHYVTRLVAPLVSDPGLVLTKAFYERPIAKKDGSLGPGGARVTEVAMRPLLQVLYPGLTGMVQPLAGECAITRKALFPIPIVSGYGVEAGMLVDIVERHGIEAVAQVDLGVRVHRNRSEDLLGETAFQVIEGLLMRLDEHGLIKLPSELPQEYVRFDAQGLPRRTKGGVTLLPPLSEVADHGA